VQFTQAYAITDNRPSFRLSVGDNMRRFQQMSSVSINNGGRLFLIRAN